MCDGKLCGSTVQRDNIKLHVVGFIGDSMINLSNIHSLSDFQRHTKDFLGKLKETKSPMVLTVKGKAEFVLQDAESYQDLLDKLEAAEDLEAIREGYDEAQAGKLTPFEEFDSDFRAKNGL
jgi:prevent-host-death family protein